MKTELATSIGTAIIGTIVAYVLCNLLISPIEEVSFKTVDSSVTTDLSEPNPEVFNYRALNPTVEVYVGDCAEYNQLGECIEEVTAEDLESVMVQESPETTTPNTRNEQRNL